jgi:thymidylate synthase (FAD)
VFVPRSRRYDWDRTTDAENHYNYLLASGWTAQMARSVLPNSLKTEIVMTANLREWRHFFRLRTSPAAHPQMREIAIPMLAEFKRLVCRV